MNLIRFVYFIFKETSKFSFYIFTENVFEKISMLSYLSRLHTSNFKKVDLKDKYTSNMEM